MTASASPVFDWNAPLGLPEFEQIADADFAPAFETALAEHDAEIKAIAENPEAPDFANTIEALELAGYKLSRVSSLFWNRAGTDTNDVIQALEREMAPRLSRHYSKIAMNRALFERVDSLYQKRAGIGLNAEQDRLLERIWKSFIKSGAALDEAGQKRLAEVGETLAGLGARFGQNVLADEKDWVMLLDEGADLEGLSDDLRAAMAAVAEDRSHKGKYAVTLSRSIIEPFLTSSERRDLRETAFKAWIARGANGGETDNAALISQIIALRSEKATLLGYDSYAAYKLDDTMAKTPDAVEALLGDVWTRAIERADTDRAELAKLIAEEGGNHDVAAWEAQGPPLCFFRSRAQAIFPARQDDRRMFRRRQPALRHHNDRAQRYPRPAPRCPGVRGPGFSRRDHRHLHRRLLCPPLKALRRLDERHAQPAQARHARRLERRKADHHQRDELRQARGRPAGAAVAR